MKKAEKLSIIGIGMAAVTLAGILLLNKRKRKVARTRPLPDHRPQTIIRNVMHKSKDAIS